MLQGGSGSLGGMKRTDGIRTLDLVKPLQSETHGAVSESMSKLLDT